MIRNKGNHRIHFIYLNNRFSGYLITCDHITFRNYHFRWVYLIEITRFVQRKGYGSQLLKNVDVAHKKKPFYEKMTFYRSE